MNEDQTGAAMANVSLPKRPRTGRARQMPTALAPLVASVSLLALMPAGIAPAQAQTCLSCGAGGGGGATNSGGGGGGGAGAVLTNGTATVGMDEAVVGGGGGGGGGNSYYGGGGGGGSGYMLDGSTLTNDGAIRGGDGGGSGTGGNFGSGGNGFAAGNPDGGGGGGTASNGRDGGDAAGGGGRGGISDGGVGGNGGSGGAGFGGTTGGGGGQSGIGGNGGSGVAGAGITITNSGSISGGSGNSGSSSTTGRGGDGIAGSHVTLTNSGSISGGLGGDGTRANAITFTGGTNSLILLQGFSISGNVVAVAGGADRLALGGAANETFDAAQIGVQYQNFRIFQKTGTGAWALTGTNSAVTPWTITSGTLSISNDGALGLTSGLLTLDGGTLLTTGTVTTSRTIAITSDSTIQTDADLVASGDISGAGSLTKTGAATLKLANANGYSGRMSVQQGTVDASVANALSGGQQIFGGTSSLSASAGSAISDGTQIFVANASLNARDAAAVSAGLQEFSDNSALNASTVDAITGGQQTFFDTSILNASAASAVSGGIQTFTNNSVLNVTATGALRSSTQIRFDKDGFSAPGGTLRLNGYSTTVGSINSQTTGSGLITNDSAAGSILSVDSSASPSIFSGIIQDGGPGRLGLTLTAGSLTLAGANTYSGGTTVNGGTLTAASAGAFVGAGAYTVNGGTLDLNGYSLTMSLLSGTGGTVALGSANLKVDQQWDTTFGGSISGTGGFTKSGMGRLKLTGAAGHAGPTSVTGGILQFGDGSSGGPGLAGAVSVSGGATLAFDTPSTFTVGGGIDLADMGTLSLKANGGLASLKAASLTLGNRVGFNLSGVDDASQADRLLIDTANGISGDFGWVAVGGYSGSVDYLSWSTRKSADGKQYLASYGLNWTAGTNQARGTFTLVDASNSFEVGTDLSDQNANANWDGRSLTKKGAGTLVLSGDNSYSGGTTIAAGTLQIGAGGTTGSIRGDVVNNGTLAFDRSGTLAMDGAISGSGTVRQIGTGTVVLSGANSYLGGTEIAAGTLSVSSDANLGDASGALAFTGGTLAATASFDTGRTLTLTGAGRFDVAANTTLGLTGTVSGTGDLVKSGLGTLKLDNGANAYGDTLVEAGVLVGNASSISGNIGNAGTLAFDQASNGSFGGTIAGLGGTDGMMVKRGAGSLTLTGTSSLNWTVEAGNLTTTADRFGGNATVHAGASLTFDQSANASYAGTLSGGGTFAKAGSGTLKLTGDSSGFAGATSVENGILSVDGKLGGAFNVLTGGRLQGNGTLGSLNVADGSTIAPGNSIGTLNVAGDVALAAGSTYEVEIAGNGASDRIAAGGKATLDGARVAVTALDAQTSYQNGQTYTILTAIGGITGSFDPAVLARSAFLDATLSQGANAVDLKIALKGTKPEEPGQPGGKPVFANVADTGSRKQTAGALDTLRQSGPSLALYNTLLLLSADEARTAFDGLSGEINASTVSGLIEDSRLVRDAINDRLRSAFETVGAEPLPLMSYGDDAKGITTSAVTSERYGAWGSAFGAWGSTGSDGNAARLSRSTGGFVTGIDGFVTNDIRLGFLAGYSHSSFKADDRGSSASSDNYHLGIYGGTQWAAFSLRSGLAHTWSDIDTSRQVSFPGFADGLSGSHRSGTTQVFGELGYAIKAGNVAFEPFANLAYVNVHTNGFTERGGAAALTVHDGSNDITFTTLGIRAASEFDLGSMQATARGMIGWRRAYGDVTPTIAQAFTGSQAFTIAGAPIAKDAAVIEAGLDFAVTPNATLGVSYHGQVGSRASDHGVRADLSVKF